VAEATAPRMRQTDEELRAELERRERWRSQEESRRQGVITAAQNAWRRELLDRHRDIDEQLREEGDRHQKVGLAAATAGDLNSAWAEYIQWRKADTTRQAVRGEVQNAKIQLDTDEAVLPDLRPRLGTFLEYLEAAEHPAAGNLAEDQLLELIGEMPSTYEEAKAAQDAAQQVNQ